MSTLIDPTPEQESLQRIAEAYREVDEAEQAEAQLKEEFAEAKAHTKEVKARFRQVLHGETVPLPLLDKPRRVEGVAHPEVPAAPIAPPASASSAKAGDASPAEGWGDGKDERWKGWPLSKLGLKPRTLANLEDADLFTVGQLAAWSLKGRPLTDLGGIGEAKAGEIDDALTAFWAERPDLAEPVAVTPEPAPEVVPEPEPEPAASAFEPPAESFEPPADWTPEADAADGDEAA